MGNFGQEMLAIVNQQARQATLGSLQFVEGEIDTYDKDQGTVTVVLKDTQDDHITGDIYLLTPWAGNGYGMQAGPPKGMPVLVLSMSADETGSTKYAIPSHYNKVDRAPGAPQDEFWITDKSGTKVKLTNNGNLALTSAKVNLTSNEAPLTGLDAVVRVADLAAFLAAYQGLVATQIAALSGAFLPQPFGGAAALAAVVTALSAPQGLPAGSSVARAQG